MCTNQIITERKEEIRGIKVSGNKDIKDFCSQMTTLQCWIQKTHYKFLYVEWKEVPLNMDQKFQQAK
jgi:hypothetical protein